MNSLGMRRRRRRRCMFGAGLDWAWVHSVAFVMIVFIPMYIIMETSRIISMLFVRLYCPVPKLDHPKPCSRQKRHVYREVHVSIHYHVLVNHNHDASFLFDLRHHDLMRVAVSGVIDSRGYLPRATIIDRIAIGSRSRATTSQISMGILSKGGGKTSDRLAAVAPCAPRTMLRYVLAVSCGTILCCSRVG